MTTPMSNLPYASQPMGQDAEHLRLLKIFYYIWAAMQAFFSLFGVIYIIIGVAMLSASGRSDDQFVGTLFLVLGPCMMLLMWVAAGLAFYTARAIESRSRYMLIMVTAGLICLNMPLGTALGVFTFIVFSRPSVKALFGR